MIYHIRPHLWRISEKLEELMIVGSRYGAPKVQSMLDSFVFSLFGSE